jgi:hypothetical protein
MTRPRIRRLTHQLELAYLPPWTVDVPNDSNDLDGAGNDLSFTKVLDWHEIDDDHRDEANGDPNGSVQGRPVGDDQGSGGQLGSDGNCVAIISNHSTQICDLHSLPPIYALALSNKICEIDRLTVVTQRQSHSRVDESSGIMREVSFDREL